MKNRRGVGEKLAVEGIPPTDYRYDDKEPTAWSWDSHDSKEDDAYPADEAARDAAIYTVIQGKERGMYNTDIAEFIPFSREVVRRR